MEKPPSYGTMSKLAEASYIMGTEGVKKKKRAADANDFVKDTDWVMNKQLSNYEISTFQHKDDPKNVVIAHRGTAVGDRGGGEDIITDLKFAMGMGGEAKMMKRRRKRTNDIIKEIRPNQLHLTGHSLGAGTVNNTIANSNVVKNALTSAKTFNGAAHPIYTNSSAVSKSDKKILDEKVEHHRIKNDPISMGFKTNVPFGKLKQHSVKFDASKGKSALQNLLERSTIIGNTKRWTEKGAHAHHINLFHDGSIKGAKKKKKGKK